MSDKRAATFHGGAVPPFITLVGIPNPGERVDATPGARTALIDDGWTPPDEGCVICGQSSHIKTPQKHHRRHHE